MYGRLLIFLLSFCALMAPAMAEKTTIIADADDWFKDFKNETLTLKGNVNVIFKQQHLLCDRAKIYEKESRIVAEGNVVLQNARTTLRGRKLELNYETGKGILHNGVVTSGQVLIEAEEILKIGEKEYEAEDAYYTACLTCPPSWGFTSSKVNAEIGGYAYIERPWLHLLQFPVLPLPYLVVPLSSKRQTGFLIPKPFSNSDGGLAVEMPFFWAIDRSHDATFSLINYEKRSQQLAGNYRYVISPTSSGELNTAIMNDKTLTNTALRDRWFVEYHHFYDLPNNYTQRTNIVLASDRFYGVDFFQQFNYNGQAALDNNMSLTKTFDDSLWTVEANYYISQIEEPYRFNQDNSIHRLPDFNYYLLDQKISDDYNIFFNLDLQYLNVVKSGRAFEHARSSTECTTTGTAGGVDNSQDVCFPTNLSDGDFVYGTPYGTTPVNNKQYGDLIRTGQRLDVMPRIRAPFWVGDVLDVDPSVAVRYTQYAFGVESDSTQGYSAYPYRFYSQFDLSTKSYINRVYDWDDETKFKHSIIPKIDLKYIPRIHRSDHNWFGSGESLKYFREIEPIDDTDADWRGGGRGIHFDNRDRVIGKQLVSIGVMNKIISRTEKNHSAVSGLGSRYERNFLFDVSQVYDLNEARKGSEARAWSFLQTTTQMLFGPFQQDILTYYYPYHNRTRWETSTYFHFGLNNFIQLSYNKNYLIEPEPPVNEDTKQELVTLGTGLNFKYVYLYASTNYDLNANEAEGEKPFRWWRLAMTLTPPGSCWTFNAEIIKTLDRGTITPSFNMEFQFGN